MTRKGGDKKKDSDVHLRTGVLMCITVKWGGLCMDSCFSVQAPRCMNHVSKSVGGEAIGFLPQLTPIVSFPLCLSRKPHISFQLFTQHEFIERQTVG